MTKKREKKKEENPERMPKEEAAKQNTTNPQKGTQDGKEKHPSHSAGYIKDKKTGKWKIVHPAGSKAYNYLYRDEFPDD